jgi:hypothetical protein
MCKALSQRLDKNVSAGLVTKVRKELGIARDRHLKPEKIGIEIAEDAAAVQKYKDQKGERWDNNDDIDKKLDEDEARSNFHSMTPAEQEREARKLGVPLPLSDDLDSRIDSLVCAKTMRDSLTESEVEDLIELAKARGIHTEDRSKEYLIRSLMPFLLDERDSGL